MDIHIENHTENEDVHHPIVLVKGHVSKLIENNSEISVLQSTSTSNSTSKWSLSSKGKFKVVLQLDPGKNLIELEYHNCQKRIMTLNFMQVQQTNPKHLQPIYLMCCDTQIDSKTLEQNCVKLLLGCKLAQCLYSEKLYESTGLRKTFTLSKYCKPYRLDIPENEAHHLSDALLWEKVAKHLITSEIWDDNAKYICFVAFTKYTGLSQTDDYTYKNIKAQTFSNPALSTGGLALIGTGCLYTWPNRIEDVVKHFNDKTKIDFRTELDDSNYRCTSGGCYSTTFGTLCHEIGHLFDLGHAKDGIMGKDVDYTSRVFTTKLHTEDLIDRKVGAHAIQKNTTKTRFTKLRQPGTYLIKYHEQKDDDLTYFTSNNAFILAHHKWLNRFVREFDENDTDNITFDSDSKHVKSRYSIALIELREFNDEMVIKFWAFTEQSTFQFKLPYDEINSLSGKLLFVIDVEGNILKQEL